MNSVDLGRCKRIVQYLWDPEPRNDEEPDTSIWCLGVEYPPTSKPTSLTHTPGTHRRSNLENIIANVYVTAGDGATDNSTEYEPGTTSTLTTNGWPEGFLSDFESKIWMTYRSNFPPIPKLDSPDSAQHMTLSVRLRSQLIDSQGFTSDTGWGCMIRSGQCLLANAMSILLLGRGIGPSIYSSAATHQS